MLDKPTIASLAGEIQAAREESFSLDPFSSRYTEFDLGDAYAVARISHELKIRRGEIARGRKIGFTNPRMWVLYDVREPVWGWMYDSTVTLLQNGQGSLSLSGFCEPKIEPEIVLHFCKAPQKGMELNEMLGCIDWVAHAFEIVDSHFPGWNFSAADTVADCGLHGNLLVGPGVSVATLGEEPQSTLEEFQVVLSCNGKPSATGKGANVLGSPILAITHLLDIVDKYCPDLALQPGELVTTGTLTEAFSVQPGEVWETRLDDIPLSGLRLELTP